MPISLIKQIYEQLRGNILNGVLRSGDRLPSTRELAAGLRVSRNIIVEAYDQLLAEGFIITRPGSGTYVAEGVGMSEAHQYDLQPACPREDPAGKKLVIDFRTGIPALDHIPRKKLAKILQSVCLDAPDAAFGPGAPEGCPEIRQALARYLSGTRGLQCSAEQVIITSGAIQAIHLVAKLLITDNSEVVIEDPINSEIRRLFLNAGASLCSVPVDNKGLDINQIPGDVKPRIIFLTPSHQCPLGGVLPIGRRIELIRLALRNDGYIVEDDYDGELRLAGSPISSLQRLNPARVIYIGTFSKILSPAFRIGYIVLPPQLISACRALKQELDRHSSILEQLMLARFIGEGHLETHILKMKRLYQRRQFFLHRSLTKHFGDRIRISGDSTGLYLIAEFAGAVFDDRLICRLGEQGVRVYPVGLYRTNKSTFDNKLMMGYGNLSESEIETGVACLAQVLAT
ncbi:MAG TPA: PLP-dependent aminotransferase family protein [Negativicutes bacterium]|nr:PLP-dependent aminotransferase family protein [Negativicutes bacterium]